jgi:glycosyltransferase involved in cell wall biosynthesis
MRVLINTTFLGSARFGGSWTYTYNLLRALDAFSAGVEFIVLTNAAIASDLGRLGMRVEVVIGDPESRTRRIAWEQFFLPRLTRKFSPSVFHSTGNTLPLMVPCPSVVTVHDFQYHFYPENFGTVKAAYLRYLIPGSLKRADAVVCISETTRQHAVDLYGVAPTKLAVIHEAGLWPGEIGLATDGRMVRKKFGIEGPFLLSAGSSMPHKNIGRLIEAYAKVMHDLPHDLVIAGEPFGHESVIRLAIEKWTAGYPQRVHVTGFVDRADLLGLYGCAEAFVFPSLFEGFGIPALEAMECGCPVVASRATSLPEIIGSAGEFFEPNSTENMARALQRVCTDPAWRGELRERGFKRAAEFSWEKMAKETMEIYRSVARS